MQTKKQERNHAIDIMKGIAIILIIITHGSWSESESRSIVFPYIIDMAVPVFMFVSGYVSAMTSYDKYSISACGKKMIRFTLPFLIFCSFEIPILCAVGKITVEEGFFSFFIGGRGPGSYYYPIMMQFVLLFPLIFQTVSKYKAAGLVLWGGINALYEGLARLYDMGAGCYRLLIFRYIFIISFGAFLFIHGRKIKTEIVWCAWLISTSFIFVVSIIGIDPIIVNKDWAVTSYIGMGYIVPIVSLGIDKFQRRLCLLEFIGKASYNVFLFQMLYFSIGYSIVKHIFNSPYVCNLLSIPICLIGGICFYLVESKVTKSITYRLIRDNRDAKEENFVDKINNILMVN